MLTLGTCFSGIDGFGLAFERAGFSLCWQIEIDPDCQDVLSTHWPDVPKFLNVSDCGKSNLPKVDVLCGGFPCQDLSVAGKRGGLAGERSGLFYEFTRIADELRPSILVWENVPGLFSSDERRDFARILRELDRIGFDGAWTSLDSRFFGVAQRRRRIFGVFANRDIGAGRCGQILSLPSRVRWHPEKSGKKRPELASDIAASLRGRADREGGKLDAETGLCVINALTTNPYADREGEELNLVASPITAALANGPHVNDTQTGRPQNLIVAKTVTANYGKQIDSSDCDGGPPNLIVDRLARSLTSRQTRNQGDTDNFIVGSLSLGAHPSGFNDQDAYSGQIIAATLNSGGNAGGFRTEPGEHLVASFDPRNITSRVNRTSVEYGAPTNTLHSGGLSIIRKSGVRRLTPRECERLQGFPDDFSRWRPNGTEICDSARYRMLGNAVTVNVVEWIAKRVCDYFLAITP